MDVDHWLGRVKVAAEDIENMEKLLVNRRLERDAYIREARQCGASWDDLMGASGFASRASLRRVLVPKKSS